jgi:tryptophan synthase alpha chain
VERIITRFAELQRQGKKAFIAYITAGDPTIESTKKIIHEIEKNGVDIIELGIPFSDPVADGPVNQEAASRALLNDVSVKDVIMMVKDLRKETNIPVVFFTYYNPVLNYGLEKFADNAKAAGVDGILVLDLPPEEASIYKEVMDKRKLATIFLVSPITPEDRLEIIGKNSTGFIYYVSQMGVTGERKSLDLDIRKKISSIKSHSVSPVVVGFGISTPEQVSEVSGYADGVVVGSAIVKKIGELGSRPGFERDIGIFVGTLTKPLKGD